MDFPGTLYDKMQWRFVCSLPDRRPFFFSDTKIFDGTRITHNAVLLGRSKLHPKAPCDVLQLKEEQLYLHRDLFDLDQLQILPLAHH